jgi:hypothetical protein
VSGRRLIKLPQNHVIKKPDFFIVGAPKCGTTAMDQYLSRCPDIFMARKELHAFGSDLHFGPQFYRRSLDAYLAEFETTGGQRCAGEASVWYLFSTEAAAEIKAFNPDARIIIMLRDPVDMLHSLYYTFRWDGNEHLPSFAEALAAEGERRAGRQLNRQTYLAQGLVYRDTVRYVEQVIRYFDVFGRDRVHVIIYDDLSSDAATVYRRTLDFLGVDSKFAPENFKAVNGNQYVKSTALRTLLTDPVVRSTLLAIRPCLPKFVFKTMQNVDARIRKFNSRPAGRPVLDPELDRQLRSEFAPQIEELSALLGRDLTHWSSHYGRTQPGSAPASVAKTATGVLPGSQYKKRTGSVIG